MFASVQSLHASDAIDWLEPDYFDVVIVDEFHHAEAATYTRLLDHLQPRYLLGLTATPERADGKDVTRWFDDRIASEMRLWDALDQQLLAPLQYFGIADDVDLSAVEWRRGGYHVGQLSDLYTGDDARTAKVLRALRDVVGDVDWMRAFGFCVSIEHARYMTQRFNDAGVTSAVITGETAAEERARTLRHLARGEIRVVFGVDVLTEGVDVPEVDMILLLRPTESVTVFLQQIGRGLRRLPSKACLTVLDFIGQQRREFRFDLRLRALTGASRGALQRQIEDGFPFLPTGCHIDLDRQATTTVLDNVRAALRLRKPELVAEVERLVAAEGDPTLQRFLAYAGVELSDLARPTIGGWVGLRHPARCRELVELADALDEQADHVTRPLSDLPGCDALTDGPLHLHASYSRDEILAAFGILQSGQRPSVREGVKHDEATNTDIFFVTVHKTEDHYSPTTMYRDYPISRELFHWESQSITTRTWPTGRRYLEGRSRIVLFVQERKTGASGAAPYLCLGPATLVEARGERPIAITWRLHHPMPQTFLDTASALVASRAEGLLGPRHRSTSPMRLVHPARRH